MSYKDIVDGKQVPNSPFEVAVFNFCLYEKDNLIELFQATKNLLNKEGKILIQTLHPYFMIQNNLEYKSQILFDSFKGLPGNFSKSHEWYARTIEDWVSLILDAKMNILELKEVVNDQKTPISLILKIS